MSIDYPTFDSWEEADEPERAEVRDHWEEVTRMEDERAAAIVARLLAPFVAREILQRQAELATSLMRGFTGKASHESYRIAAHALREAVAERDEAEQRATEVSRASNVSSVPANLKAPPNERFQD